jgi:sugar phosphate isomerase/epimerase
MNRRDFIQQSAFTGSMLMIQPTDFLKTKPRHIGVQVYSVRDAADKNPAETFTSLARMGYHEVEGYNYMDSLFYQWTPTLFRRFLKDTGLAMTSAHTGFSLTSWNNSGRCLSDEAQRCVDDHAELGVSQLICPYLDETNRSPEAIKKLCEVFNHVGDACKKNGIQFGYHNHNFEFGKTGGSLLMDQLLGGTDPELVVWEMDLYWVVYANEDPISWIKKYPGRISAFHVKDMAATPQRETIEVGEGTIDFEAIFNFAKLAGVQYYFVELEHYKRTSMESVEISLKNLNQLLSH